ncbi:hypothetical protein LTR95_007298 [Oleoguttula sp. CCFEE 5521]
MSNEGGRNPSQSQARASPAANVSFTAHRDAESSSHAESRGSTEASSERGGKLKERFLTPTRDRSSDKKDEPRRSQESRKSGGVLRHGAFDNQTPRSSGEGSSKREGKRKVMGDRLTVGKSRRVDDRLSVDSTYGSSPLSRQVSGSQDAVNDARDQGRPRPTTLDPAQLVQMALSLSESRKRHASNTLPVPLQLSAPRSRLVSGGSGIYGSARSPASASYRASLSRNTPSPRHSSAGRENMPVEGIELKDDDMPHDFSAGTLARAEKARRFFELANEHRRVLQVLPPLKPDAKASGNFLYHTISSPGYAAAEIQRVRSSTSTKHELGRQYNPLQVLRNRKLRTRERRPLAVTPEMFQDAQEVQFWVDMVEEAARRPHYRTTDDVVDLPTYHAYTPNVVEQEIETSRTHRRSGTAATATYRAEDNWSVEPAELLADLYWTEKGDNKTLIENRRHQRIFSPRTNQRLDPPRQDLGDESDEHVDDPAEKQSPNDEGSSQRKHRPFLSLHKADRIRRNRLAHFKRSASVSSVSSGEGDKVTPLGSSLQLDYLNTGPLQRHMEVMIAKEERGELKSPDLVSPDHWDSQHTAFPNQRSRAISGADDKKPKPAPNGTLSIDVSQSTTNSKAADGRVEQLAHEPGRSSIDFTPPLTPAVTTAVPSLTLDVSPATDNTPPSVHKSRSSRFLPHFRSKSKDRNTTENRDFAFPSEDDRSREPSGITVDPTRLSSDSARPSQFRRHRTNDSVHSVTKRNGLHKTVTLDGSIKEPESAVGRFFRGGRLGELVRGEGSRFSGRLRGREHDDMASDANSAVISYASDSDGSGSEAPGLTSANDSEASPRTSIDRTRRNGPKLPTFRPVGARDKLATPSGLSKGSTGMDDPVNRQAALQRQTSRSERFARLAPPRIDVSAEDDDYSTDKPTLGSPMEDERRKRYGLLGINNGRSSALSSKISLAEPGTMGRGGGKMPVTGLTKLQSDARRRHWSISDQAQRSRSAAKDRHVTPRDLARARTLILASGIKAQAIIHRASVPRDPPPSFLAKAAATASKPAPTGIALRDSHMTAASLLSNHLTLTLESFTSLSQAFASTSLPQLHTRLSDLKSLASDHITHLVHNSSDEADAFTVRLTTEQTLRIQQVDDAVDAMLRLRRRQWRWAKRTGFKVLEWMVLGLMWGIWGVVVLINVIRKVMGGVWDSGRWVLTW